MSSVLELFNINIEDCDFIRIPNEESKIQKVKLFDPPLLHDDRPIKGTQVVSQPEEDSVLDLLLAESNYQDIETLLLTNDQGRVFGQLTKLFKKMSSLLTDLLSDYKVKKEQDFERILTIFLETYHYFSFSNKRSQCQTEQFFGLEFSQEFLNSIWVVLTSDTKLRNKDMVLRLFVFLLTDTKPYIKSPSCTETFQSILNLVMKDESKNVEILQIIGQLFLTNREYAELSPLFHKVVIQRTHQLLNFLNSKVEDVHAFQSLQYYNQLAKLLNLLYIGNFNVYLYDLNLSQQLYDHLRTLSQVFAYPPIWVKENRFIQYLVNLIRLNIGFLARLDIQKQPPTFQVDLDKLSYKIVNDFLFLIQKKRSNCKFVKEILPQLIQTHEHSYSIYSLHNDEGVERIKKVKKPDSIFEFANGSLPSNSTAKINHTLNPNIQKKIKQTPFEWQKITEFSMEDPPTFQEKVLAKLIGKKQTIMVFELSAPQGSIKLVVSLSDPFVQSDYTVQQHHTYTEKEFNVGGKILTSRSNDDSFVFIFDGDKDIITPSSHKFSDINSKHPNNMKTFVEIMPTGLNAYVDRRKFISINFQDANSSQFSITSFNESLSQDLILLSGEIWVLEETKQKATQSSSLLDPKLIHDFNDPCRVFTQDLVGEFEQKFSLGEILVVDGGVESFDGETISQKSVAIKKQEESKKPLKYTKTYPIVSGMIKYKFLQELIHILSLECNSIARPHVQIFLFDCYTLLQIEEWQTEVLTKQNGKWVYGLTQMALFEIEDSEDTHKIFHQTLLSAYEALSKCNIGKESPTLQQLLLNRAQIYYPSTLNLKLTQEQKDKKLKQNQEEKKIVKKVKAKIQDASHGTQLKGIGYGDVSNTNLVIQKDDVKVEKKKLNHYESDKMYQSLADECNYRWDILNVLLKCLTNHLKDRKLDIKVHQEVKYSVLPAIIYSMLKSYSISDVMQSDRQQTFYGLLSLIESLCQDVEYGDLFIDKEYGGSDSDRCIYDLLKKLNDEGQFYGETTKTQIKLCSPKKSQHEEKMKEQLEKEKQNQIDRFLVRLNQVFLKTEAMLEQGQFITISFEDVSSTKTQDDSEVNLGQFYQPFMKGLILDSCVISDQPGFLAQMNSYFNGGVSPSQTKMKQLVKELSNIAQALPCEGTNSIFLRYDKNHMDVMRSVIFGSSGTPYAHGAFLYNLYFCDDYPQRPPKCQLETTGHGKVRFNPNLYNCGKVCLSLLGTWGDNWIPNVSTLLQILISIQSMVMSEYVYFNEPGWEHSMGTPEGDSRNRGYCNIVKLANIRYAMIEAIREPAQGFEDVILKSFYLRKDLIMKEMQSWIEEADILCDYSGSQNHNISQPFSLDSSKYKSVLKSEVAELEKELQKLKLKVQGTLNINGTGEQKKLIKINHGKVSKLYSKQVRRAAQQKKKQEVQDLFNQPLTQVDVSYDQAAIKKSFNINSSEVQNLMSRYIGVMGIESVQKQSQASVFLYGLSAVGVEVAKNLILSGLKRITIVDLPLSHYSTDGQFYMKDNQDRLQQNLGKLSHLNPYVQIDSPPAGDAAKDVLKSQGSPFEITNYNLVVVCDYVDYADLIDIASTCRAHNVPIILGETASYYGRVLVDYGDSFMVHDKDGEPVVEVNLDTIESNGLVSLAKGQKHPLQDGDIVVLKEVLTQQEPNLKDLNNVEFRVKVVSRTQFNIGSLDGYKTFVRNGIAVTRKQKTVVNNKPLEQCTTTKVPWDDIMTVLFEDSAYIKRDISQILFKVLKEYKSLSNQTYSVDDSIAIFNLIMKSSDWADIESKNKDFREKHTLVSEQVLQFCLTYGGHIHAQAAYIGGIVAQEVIKAITHKYMPINQAYLHTCEELCVYQLKDLSQFIENGLIKRDDLKLYVESKIREVPDRYTKHNILLGTDFLLKIQNSKLFMIGAGAIGCELLKNYAMLGLGSGATGRIILTDPDIIEQSNLNRQFLFREKHIRKPKSTTAACAAIQMNPDLQGKLTARLDKVHLGTESTYSNSFYQELDIVTNALDNVQARLYIDSRCVENSKPLVESGTLGPKGHVQVIIPFQTESYGSKRDPEEDNEIPYCTLKMFPEETLHCLEWARDKFEKMFFTKPSSLKQVLSNITNPQAVQISQLETTLRLFNKKPKNFVDCLKYARNKFQKFFHNALLQLLKAYPLDQKDDKGKLFWQSPKRPPLIQEFNPKDENHLKFIISAAVLWAEVNNIPVETQLLEDEEKIQEVLTKIQPDHFKIDETKLQQIQKQVQEQSEPKKQTEEIQQEVALEQSSPNELVLQILAFLGEYFTFSEDPDNLNIKIKKQLDDKVLLNPIAFEKDDDQNRHINFIQAGTNCRAYNYKLEPMDWLQVKLKAGRIVPAMATTTSCISGLQTIEAIKLLKSYELSNYKNTFLNLAVPLSMQAEPGECETITISEGLKTSFWTRWIVDLDQKNSTVGGFMDYIQKQYGVQVTGIKQGGKVIFLPLMFASKEEGEIQRFFTKPLITLLDQQDQDEYVELDVTLCHKDGKEISQPPKIRVML